MRFGKEIMYGIMGLGAAAIGYSVYVSHKIGKLAANMDTTVDAISKNLRVEVEDAIVEEAINRAADKEVEKEVKATTKRIMGDVKNDISKQVRQAVDTSYYSIRNDVKEEINKQIGNIDVREIRRDVIDGAKERAAEKFDDELDDILEKAKDKFETEMDNLLDKYNAELKSVSKIYGSIADTLSGSTNDKGVKLTLG